MNRKPELPAAEDAMRKSAAIFALAENFGKEMSEALVAMWLRGLKPWTAEQVEAGAAMLALEWRWRSMPPLGALAAAVRRACGQPEPMDAEREQECLAEAEWLALLGQIRRIGSWGRPVFRHPATGMALRAMGGWAAACSWPSASLDFKRGDFVRLWKDFSAVGPLAALGAPGAAAAIQAGRSSALPAGTHADAGRRTLPSPRKEKS